MGRHTHIAAPKRYFHVRVLLFNQGSKNVKATEDSLKLTSSFAYVGMAVTDKGLFCGPARYLLKTLNLGTRSAFYQDYKVAVLGG